MCIIANCDETDFNTIHMTNEMILFNLASSTIWIIVYTILFLSARNKKNVSIKELTNNFIIVSIYFAISLFTYIKMCCWFEGIGFVF